VIDHINPLECGGADAPFNMQWQTIAEGKAKDRLEKNCKCLSEDRAKDLSDVCKTENGSIGAY
jgi:hypothetical protein